MTTGEHSANMIEEAVEEQPYQHTPYFYPEWISHWRSKSPAEVYMAVRGRTWTECGHVREQAAMEVCMEVLGDVLRTVGAIRG